MCSSESFVTTPDCPHDKILYRTRKLTKSKFFTSDLPHCSCPLLPLILCPAARQYCMRPTSSLMRCPGLWYCTVHALSLQYCVPKLYCNTHTCVYCVTKRSIALT